jgi:hypothetical protein
MLICGSLVSCRVKDCSCDSARYTPTGKLKATPMTSTLSDEAIGVDANRRIASRVARA